MVRAATIRAPNLTYFEREAPLFHPTERSGLLGIGWFCAARLAMPVQRLGRLEVQSQNGEPTPRVGPPDHSLRDNPPRITLCALWGGGLTRRSCRLPGVSDKVRFAPDSLLEGDGFEPSVPGTKEPVSVAEGELRDRTGGSQKGLFLMRYRWLEC